MAQTSTVSGSDANCFGCSQQHSKGLRMLFHAHDDGSLVSHVQLSPEYESYAGVIHGGIVATLLDEAMARAVLANTVIPSVTTGIRVRYARVMKSQHPYRIVAKVTANRQGIVSTEAELTDDAGTLTATASGTFMSLTQERISNLEAGLPSAMVDSVLQFKGTKD